MKVLTGSPLPGGADAIVPFEETHFTEQTVTLFKSVRPGGNVIRAGEDVRAGSLLAAVGTPIDSGLAATLAGQGVAEPTVFRKPKVGIVATGSELVEPGHPLKPGMIYNTSRYALAAALARDGVEPAFIGNAGDDVDAIAARIMDGLGRCDALVLTRESDDPEGAHYAAGENWHPVRDRIKAAFEKRFPSKSKYEV